MEHIIKDDDASMAIFDAMLVDSVKVTGVTGVFGIHPAEEEAFFFPIMRCPGLVLPELAGAETGDDMDYAWTVSMGSGTADALLDVDWGEGREIRLHFPLDSTVRRAFSSILEAGGKFGISPRAGGSIDDALMMEIELDDEAFKICVATAQLIEERERDNAAGG